MPPKAVQTTRTTSQQLFKKNINKSGCFKSPYNRDTFLIWACSYNLKSYVDLLLEIVENLDDEDSLGCTALLASLDCGHLSIAEKLLSRGADVNKGDNLNRTAIFFASAAGNTKIVRLCIEHKANIDIGGDFDESTPLMFACLNGHEEVVSILLKNGANPNARDANRRTALMYAAQKGRYNIIKKIIDFSQKLAINDIDDKKQTALDYAVLNGCEKTINILNSHGAVVGNNIGKL